MLPRSVPLARLTLLALAMMPAAFPPARACTPDSDEEAMTTDLPEALDALWLGRPDQRREAAENAGSWFPCPASSSEGSEVDEATPTTVAWLRTILRAEKDDWIRARLLQNLVDVPAASLTPLYLEALRDPSPNVRWR